jgi:hypothetical protein
VQRGGQVAPVREPGRDVRVRAGGEEQLGVGLGQAGRQDRGPRGGGRGRRRARRGGGRGRRRGRALLVVAAAGADQEERGDKDCRRAAACCREQADAVSLER